MLLDPVGAHEPIELRDKDAAAPKSLPKGDELKEEIDALLKRLTELQNVFMRTVAIRC